MQFSHLVEINDPQNPLINPITREQLWRGLVLRAELPGRFIPWLDKCDILQRREDGIDRVLHYGATTIRDFVRYEMQTSVLYEVPSQADIPGANLVMRIEEPVTDSLFVRFEYNDGNTEPESKEEAMVNDFRRSAYKEADIDTIRIIREMAANGLLDAPLI